MVANDELLNHKVQHLAKKLDKTIVVQHKIAHNVEVLASHTRTLAEDTIAAFAQIEMLRMSFLMSEQVAVLGDTVQEIRYLLSYVKDLVAVHTSRHLSPGIIPPSVLRGYIRQMKEELEKYPKLELPLDEEGDIWPFYSLMRTIPILCEEFMIFVVEMPLRSKDMHMNLYKVHNLPAIHPQYELAITYAIEGHYYAVSNDREYVSIPDEKAVAHCEKTGHTVCHFKAPLYPRTKCKFCLCALFDDILEDQQDRISANCPVTITNTTRHRAVYLEDNLWAIVTSRNFQMQIVCREKTSYQQIQAPLGFVNLTGGCMGLSTELFLPSLTQVTSVMDMVRRDTLVNQFTKLVRSYGDLKIWNYMNFSTHGLEAIAKFKLEALPKLPTRVDMGLINQKLQEISLDTETAWYEDKFLWIFVALGILTVITGVLVYCMFVRGKWSVVMEAIRSRKSAKETLTEVARELLSPAEKASAKEGTPVRDPRSPRPSVAPPSTMELQTLDGEKVEPMGPLLRAYSSMGYLDPPPPEEMGLTSLSSRLTSPKELGQARRASETLATSRHSLPRVIKEASAPPGIGLPPATPPPVAMKPRKSPWFSSRKNLQTDQV